MAMMPTQASALATAFGQPAQQKLQKIYLDQSKKAGDDGIWKTANRSLRGTFRDSHGATVTTYIAQRRTKEESAYEKVAAQTASSRVAPPPLPSSTDFEVRHVGFGASSADHIDMVAETLTVLVTLNDECSKLAGTGSELNRLDYCRQAAKALEDAFAKSYPKTLYTQATIALLSAVRLVPSQDCIAPHLILWADKYAPAQLDQEMVRSSVMSAHPGFWPFIIKCILHGDMGAAAILLEQAKDSWLSSEDETVSVALIKVLRTCPKRPADALPGAIVTDHSRHAHLLALRKYNVERRKWTALVHMLLEQYQSSHIHQRAATQRKAALQSRAKALSKNEPDSIDADDFDFFFEGKHVKTAASDDEDGVGRHATTDDSDVTTDSEAITSYEEMEEDQGFEFYHEGVSVTPTKRNQLNDGNSSHAKKVKATTLRAQAPLDATEMAISIFKLLLGNTKHLVEVASTPLDAILGWLILCHGDTPVGEVKNQGDLDLIKRALPQQQSALMAQFNIVLREDSKASYALSQSDPMLGAIVAEILFQTGEMYDLSLQAGFPRTSRQHCMLEFFDLFHGELQGDVLWQSLDAMWMLGSEGQERVKRVLLEQPLLLGADFVVEQLPQYQYCVGKIFSNEPPSSDKLKALDSVRQGICLAWATQRMARKEYKSAIDAYGRAGQKGLLGLNAVANDMILSFLIGDEAPIRSDMTRLSRQKEAGVNQHIDHPRLAFLQYLISMQDYIKRNEHDRAGRLLCSLMKDRIAPKDFWLRMIHDFLTSLPADANVSYSDTMDLLSCLEEVVNASNAQSHLLFLWRTLQMQPGPAKGQVVVVPAPGTSEYDAVSEEAHHLVLQMRARICSALQSSMRSGTGLFRPNA